MKKQKIEPAPSSALAERNLIFMVELGILKGTGDDLDAINAWGRVCDDAIVRQRASAKYASLPPIPENLAADFEADIFSDEFWAASLARLRATEGIIPEVLSELSRAERLGLKERLLHVREFPARS